MFLGVNIRSKHIEWLKQMQKTIIKKIGLSVSISFIVNNIIAASKDKETELIEGVIVAKQHDMKAKVLKRYEEEMTKITKIGV